MNEAISKMLSTLKENRWTKHAIEKKLGFANGTLGKVEKGQLNLTKEKEKLFHEFYARYGAFYAFQEIPASNTKINAIGATKVAKLDEKRLSQDPIREEIDIKLSELGSYSTPSAEIVALEAQIKAIRAEKQPEQTKTPMGTKAWNFDQNKRIKAIQDQISNLKSNF